MLNVGAFPSNPQCLCDSAVEKKKFPVDAENIPPVFSHPSN